MSFVPKGKEHEERPSPMNDPERKEGIFIAINHEEFGPQSRRAMIDHVDGKRQLGEWETMNGINFGGRFGNFVPPKGFAVDKHKIAFIREGIKQLKIMDDIVPLDDYVEQMKEEVASGEGQERQPRGAWLERRPRPKS